MNVADLFVMSDLVDTLLSLLSIAEGHDELVPVKIMVTSCYFSFTSTRTIFTTINFYEIVMSDMTTSS